MLAATAGFADGETYQLKKVNTVPMLSLSSACISVHPRAASCNGASCRTSSSSSDSTSGASFSSASESASSAADPNLGLAPPLPVSRPRSRFCVSEGPGAAPSESFNQVFVYGSLLPGLHNHGLLRRAEFLGYHKTTPHFDMFSLGSYPAVCGDGHTAVAGAVYNVDKSTLRALDQLEGHPRWYKRELVDLSTTPQRAWMYLMPRHEPEVSGGWAEQVPSGDWFDFYASKEAKRLASRPAALHQHEAGQGLDWPQAS